MFHLALLNRYIQEPWNAPPAQLQNANVTLGKTYPHPIIDHQMAREDALHAFSQFQQSQKGPVKHRALAQG